MRRAAAWVLVLAAASAFAAGCGSDSSKQDAAAAARARARAAQQARLVAAGRPVFMQHCNTCHTIEGKVAHPTFKEVPMPDLDEVKPEAPYVERRIEVGGFDMPTIRSQLTEAQLRAVVAYVVAVSGSRIGPTSTDASALALGRAVFAGHCQRCHTLAGRRYTGRPTFPGTDFDKVKPSQALVMRRMLHGIEEQMPSFRGKLSAAQMRAVAAYVNATARG